jgi:hypothetical protein
MDRLFNDLFNNGDNNQLRDRMKATVLKAKQKNNKFFFIKELAADYIRIMGEL